MGKPDQESAVADPKGDRRRRARPWGTVVSPAQARDGAASAARRGSRVRVAGRAAQWRDQFLAAGQARLKSWAPDVGCKRPGPVGGGRPFGPTEVEAMKRRRRTVWRAAGPIGTAARRTTSRACRRRGPVGAAPERLASADLKPRPFTAKGTGKPGRSSGSRGSAPRNGCVG